MNDFTKEELRRMKNAIEYQSDLMDYPSKDVDTCIEISNKIQSMIDNYCEHEYMTFLQDHNNEPFLEKCMKCHALRFLKDIE